VTVVSTVPAEVEVVNTYSEELVDVPPDDIPLDPLPPDPTPPIEDIPPDPIPLDPMPVTGGEDGLRFFGFIGLGLLGIGLVLGKRPKQ
jgi:LPXTG-motif cell wall-anchored protein